MKTIDEILQETSVSLGYFNFNDAVKISSAFHMKIYVEKAMQEYAKQVAEAQREACAENAQLMDDPRDTGKYEISQIIDKESILETPLVTDNI